MASCSLPTGSVNHGELTKTLLRNYIQRIKNLEDEFSMEQGSIRKVRRSGGGH
jgi:uncharacterized protein (UPF0335 family)